MTKKIVGRGWVFPPQVGANGVKLTRMEDELEQSMMMILGTAPRERVMRPEFGCEIHSLMFEPNNYATAVKAEGMVRDALGMWEPRVRVQSVVVEPDYNSESNGRLLITVEYEIKATRDKRTLVYPFYTIPGE